MSSLGIFYCGIGTQGGIANGLLSGAPRTDKRYGTTNRSVVALIWRLPQARMNKVRLRCILPDDHIRQAHLGLPRQGITGKLEQWVLPGSVVTHPE
jgi:hypothetical protein